MQANLEAFLSGNVSIEMLETFKQAIDVFDHFNIDTYQDQYDELLYSGDTIEPNEQIDIIIQYTEDILISILRQHGIMVSDDIQLDQLVTTTTALWNVQNVEDVSHILDITSINISSIEKISDILSIVSLYKPEQFLLFITEVSDSLINTITKLCNSKVKNTIETIFNNSTLDKQIIAKVEQLIADNRNCYLYSLLKHGLIFNLPFRSYLDLYYKDIIELEDNEIARTLLGLNLVSSDVATNPMELVMNSLNKYIPDMIHLTAINEFISQFFITINRAAPITAA